MAIASDADAFGELVSRHQSALRRFLRRLLAGDDSTADDLAQETFLAAYQKMHTFRGASTLSTWLHTIAYRQFLSHRRKHRRVDVVAEAPDTGRDSREAIDDEILARQLLSLLGAEDRACMTLSYGAGMSHADIAEVVGQPVGSVKSRIHRAKIKLQTWLNEHDHSLQTTARAGNPDGEERHAG